MASLELDYPKAFPYREVLLEGIISYPWWSC